MNITVFGAASPTIDKKYIEKCEELGKEIAKRGYGLVFGAGTKGVMGAVAKGACSEKGEIIGVVPEFFRPDGLLFDKCTELIFTENMRDRKALLDERCDAFIVAPGGLGTMDELFEVYTLIRLKKLDKPLVIYNLYGFYDKLREMLLGFVEEDALTLDAVNDILLYTDDPIEAIDYIEKHIK